ALGEEGLAQRPIHLAAFGERIEAPLGIRFVLRVEGERKALEVRLAAAVAVGSHHLRVADAEVAMHDLVAGIRRVVLRIRILLVADHRLDLGAEALLVELERLLRAAFEKQIGLDLHYELLSTTVFIWVSPCSNIPPTILSMFTNMQMAFDRKLFWPVMVHVTAVRSEPAGLKLNSAVLVAANGLMNS